MEIGTKIKVEDDPNELDTVIRYLIYSDTNLTGECFGHIEKEPRKHAVFYHHTRHRGLDWEILDWLNQLMIALSIEPRTKGLDFEKFPLSVSSLDDCLEKVRGIMEPKGFLVMYDPVSCRNFILEHKDLPYDIELDTSFHDFDSLPEGKSLPVIFKWWSGLE